MEKTVEVLCEKSSNISRESFADDLNKERGILRSRVTLLLRSSKTKPFVLQICHECVRACVRQLSFFRFSIAPKHAREAEVYGISLATL